MARTRLSDVIRPQRNIAPPRKCGVIVFVVIVSITLPSCITTKTADGRRLMTGGEKFRHYVEQVFRRQNRVMDDLIYLLPEIEQVDESLLNRLMQAESEILESCRYLNSSAAGYRDNRKPGFFKRIKVSRSVAGCDRAAQQTQSLLNEFSK